MTNIKHVDMIWIGRHPRASASHLGFIPSFLTCTDHRPARDQIADNYCGGWRPFRGFDMLPSGDLAYPGDPVTQLLFETRLRDETVRVYEYAWVAVVQLDGSFEVARLD